MVIDMRTIVASNAAEKQRYPHTRASFDENMYLNIDISDFNNVDLEEETLQIHLQNAKNQST